MACLTEPNVPKSFGSEKLERDYYLRHSFKICLQTHSLPSFPFLPWNPWIKILKGIPLLVYGKLHKWILPEYFYKIYNCISHTFYHSPKTDGLKMLRPLTLIQQIKQRLLFPWLPIGIHFIEGFVEGLWHRSEMEEHNSTLSAGTTAKRLSAERSPNSSFGSKRAITPLLLESIKGQEIDSGNEFNPAQCILT